MAFTVGFMWFWEEREKERDEITTDFKERERKDKMAVVGCACPPSFTAQDKNRSADGWL
jgi:hypothetical protein